MGVWDNEGNGTKAVSFDGPPGTGYRGMVVLEVQEDVQARVFGTGEVKCWKHKSGPLKGQPNVDDPIWTSPILVWVPGPNGTGLVDPTVPGDDGVRTLWCEVAKNLTKTVFAKKKDAGRRGAPQSGDVIGVWYTEQDATTRLKSYDGEYQLGTADTIAAAARILAAHRARKAAENAAPAPASNTWADEAPAAAPTASFPGQVHDTAPAAPAAAAPVDDVAAQIAALQAQLAAAQGAQPTAPAAPAAPGRPPFASPGAPAPAMAGAPVAPGPFG
jgi:hypothetical protein